MRENYFTKSMRKKTDNELQNILSDKTMYTAEALQAVIWELEDRGVLKADQVLLHEQLINVEEKESKTLTETLDNTDKSSFNEFEKPTLYSKKSIQGFTIFFSTIFGTVLLMSNLKEVDKPKERTQVLIFGISYTILSYVLLIFFGASLFLPILFNLVGYAILVEYFWNKHLGKDLLHQKKSVVKPLIISLFILVLLVLLQFLPELQQV